MNNLNTKTLYSLINEHLSVFAEAVGVHRIPSLDIRVTTDDNVFYVDIIVDGKDFMEHIIRYNLIYTLINNIKLLIDDVYVSKFIDEDGVFLDTDIGSLTIYLQVPVENNTPENFVGNIVGKRITRETLDQIFESVDTWDLVPKDRSFDEVKIEQYLSSLDDPTAKEIAEVIIDNTRYVKFDELKEALIKQVNRLPDKFNLYFDITGSKVGSEHWLVMVLWPWLRNKVNKVITIPEEIDDILPLVIIDDAMYSGQQMINLLDYIVSHYNFIDSAIETGIQPLTNAVRTKNKLLNMNVFLVIGYVNDIALKKIEVYSEALFNNQNAHIYVYTENIIRNVYFYLKHFYTSDASLDFIDYMAKMFGILDVNMALYFDHKIAGAHSSIPFYNQIVKQPPSREKIKLLEDKLNQLEF